MELRWVVEILIEHFLVIFIDLILEFSHDLANSIRVLIPEHLYHRTECTGIGKVKHESKYFPESDLLARTSK